MSVFWNLFYSFFKIGLFTFGGGYAMLPLLKAETVERRQWLTEEELLDYFSIGQCTPGIIAVNVSTFCGYKIRGTIGAITATTAIIAPSLLIITLIASVLNHFADHPLVSGAFSGIRLGVTALLINLIWDMGKKIYHDSPTKILHTFVFGVSALLLLFGNVSAVMIVIFATLTGLLADVWKGRKQ